MKRVGVVALLLALSAPVGAGEIVFVNGSRLSGELSNDVLVLSTGSDLLELAPEQVAQLTRDEVRLKDGRVLRGTLVGGHVRARTPLGELTINLDELRVFQADAAATPGASPTAPAAAGVPGADADATRRTSPPPVAAAKDAGAPPAPPPAPAPARSPATSPALPSVAPPAPPPVTTPPPSAAPPTPTPAPPPAPPPAAAPGLAPVAPAAPPSEPAPTAAAPKPDPVVALAVASPPDPPLPAGARLQVTAAASALYRDAVATAVHVGRVVRGEVVTCVDFIDRRLRILNRVIFDGGYWIKVRAADGTVGWLPAETVREVR